MVPALAVFFRYKGWRWCLAKPHFGYHESWPHAAPPEHVQRQETCPSDGHSGHCGHLSQQLRLEACPPIPDLRNQEDPRVLEESLVVVESVWAHLLELGQPLSLQDLLHRITALPNTWRAAWTQGATCCGNERTGDAGGDPDHVLKNAIFHRFYLVVDVEPVRTAGEEVEQMTPAGLRLLGLGHQLLHNKIMGCRGNVSRMDKFDAENY